MSEQDKPADVIERAHTMAGWGPYNDDAESRMKAAIRVVLEDAIAPLTEGDNPYSTGCAHWLRAYAASIGINLAPDQPVTEPLQSEAET